MQQTANEDGLMVRFDSFAPQLPTIACAGVVVVVVVVPQPHLPHYHIGLMSIENTEPSLCTFVTSLAAFHSYVSVGPPGPGGWRGGQCRGDQALSTRPREQVSNTRPCEVCEGAGYRVQSWTAVAFWVGLMGDMARAITSFIPTESR